MSAHPRFRHIVRISLAVTFLVAGTSTSVFAQGAFAGGAAPETAPAFESPELTPSLLDFATGLPVANTIKELLTPKLLRKPFAGAPIDSAKGLAAKIKAQELDVKNRITAAEFLAEVDCRAYPNAQKQLIKLMIEDPSEEVRLAAVEALQVQFSRGLDCEKASKAEKRRYDTCRGCCTQEAIDAVYKVAYEMDPEFKDCLFEPSKRVRKAAAEAVEICRDLCKQRGMDPEPEPTPEPTPEPPAKKAEPAPKKVEPAPKKAEPAPKKAEPAPKKAAPAKKAAAQLIPKRSLPIKTSGKKTLDESTFKLTK